MNLTKIKKTYPYYLIEYFQSKIIEWGKNNFANFPWRSTKNKWHALVAEIMLQRTRADQIVDTYLLFSKRYKTPSDFLLDDETRVFSNLGLHWREEKLKELAKALSKSEIPASREDLESLPGIGSYIAAAYRSMHIGKWDYIIDSNIVRILGRYFGFKTNPETRRKKDFVNLVKAITPDEAVRDYNYGILDLTRSLCTNRPKCQKCPLNKKCDFFPSLIFEEEYL